ncbi:MAG TPA: cobalamin-dependent protein [Bacillota bacterium]|jgi:5-methyltetrahydrofolate--homocysteine methyltransferase|nr:5-methyltetrahydrofolate--homocysteine methyltransferase [Bacillota bacterium]HOA36392.1 cobalamin-dependent protein [Bacillota bacterium]HOJ83732.1 cobalamin-dependent protein [Bacillota bacterium]HOL15716.1 cobalamin-dependent protein [Bacillota bacterium]HPZ11958.1 cobalamin-dependent protein [Bacillota bacterium]
MAKDELALAIANLERDKVLSLVKERLQAGVKPMEIINSLQEGMVEVGNRFEKGEFFLSELIFCGEIMKEAMVELEPKLAAGDREYRGTVVIGTVKGDIHDLGKNIVVMLLKGAGYNVVDLGVDVAPEKFVEAARETKTSLVAMSMLLTSVMDKMKECVQAVKESGLNVKVLIGGPIIDDKVMEFSGADYGSAVASDAAKIAGEVYGAA